MIKIYNQRGMTLLEIILAMALLGIMCVGLLSMITFNVITIAKAGNSSKATYQTRTQVEDVLVSKYSGPASGINITFPPASGIGSVTAPGAVHQRTQTVNNITENITFFQPSY